MLCSFLCIYHSISKIVLEEALLCIDWQIDNAVWVGSYVCCLIHNFLLNNSGIDLAPTIMYVILFKINKWKDFLCISNVTRKKMIEICTYQKSVRSNSGLHTAHVLLHTYTTRLAIVHTHRLLEGKKFWKFNWVHFAH